MCISCWAVLRASVLTGHGQQKSFETTHDTDGQQQEHPANAHKVLDGRLLLEFVRPSDVGWPEKLQALV